MVTGGRSDGRVAGEAYHQKQIARKGTVMSLPTTKLLKKEEVAERTVSFYFEKPAGFEYKAGQVADYTF